MRNWLGRALCTFVWALLFISTGAQSQRIQASPAEDAWLVAHPVVRVGLAREFPPYYFFDAAGRPHGFAVEMLDLWSQRTGLHFEFHRYAGVAEMMAGLKAREIDLTPLTTPIDAYRSFATFPRPAFVTNLVLAARRDVPDVSATSNFGGRSVAVEQGSDVEAMVRARYPEATLKLYADAEAALHAVASGQADLFIGYQHVIVYHVERALLANIELRTNIGPSATPLGPAVRSDLPELDSLLDKAIASISQVDSSRLAQRWLPAGSTSVALPAIGADLSTAERTWVRKNSRIRVGYDASFAPITQRGELNTFEGLGADVLTLAAHKAGLEVEQQLGGSFAAVYAKGVAGDLDVIVGMARAPQRRADYDFVGPFISVPTALVMRHDASAFITDTQEIGARKLALLREHFLIPELRARHPGITLLEFDRQEQVLAAVADGTADVGLGNIQVVDDLIERRYAGEVRITGTVHDGDSELFFGVPRRSPELTRVLRAGLEAINDSEMSAIRARWLLVQVSAGPSWRAVLQVVLPLALAAAVYIFLLARGNRRLRVSREREREARAQAEESTAARSRFIAYLSHELRGGLGAVAAGAEMMQGQSEAQLRGRLLTAIVDSVNSLRRVLDTTLAYEQSLQAPLELHPEATDLQRWWTESLAPGQLAAERKGLGFEARWSGPAPIVQFDAVRLQQVLQNLVGNAVKFTEHGEVVVSGGLQAIGHANGDAVHELQMDVRDSGPGLTEADRERMFQPYAQGQQGRALRQGAGLGLAICLQIVQAMRGRIEVESHAGQGAHFRIVVPVG